MVDFAKERDGSIVLATFTGCHIGLFARTAVGLCIGFRRAPDGPEESVQVSIPPDEARQLARLLESVGVEGLLAPPPGTPKN